MNIKRRFISFLILLTFIISGVLGSVSASAIVIDDSNNPDDDKFLCIMNVKNTEIILPSYEYVHTNKEIKPKVTVKYTLSGNTYNLTLNKDYTVTYTNNVNVGTATVTVKGTNLSSEKYMYLGTVTTTFSIVHNYSSEWTIDKPATCTDEGSKSHRCTVCGDQKNVTVIPATGHKYSSEWTIDKPATCTEKGSKSHRCTVCGDQKDVTVIPATGHNYSSEWTIDKAATCGEEGIKSHHCTLCDDKTDITVIPADSNNHIFDIVDVIKQPTCTETGERHVTCSNCNTSKDEIIPALGHQYEDTVVEPTYLTDGYTSHTCSVCGDYYEDNIKSKLVLSNVSGFKVSATNANAIKLVWGKVNNADGYVVYRYNTSTKKWVRIAKTGSLTFTDKNLNSGTSYKYAIRAYKTVDGKEVLSPSYPTVTTSTNPANVSGFKVSATSASAIKLAWNKTSGANGYIVYRYNTSTKKWVRIAKTASLTFTDKNLKSGTSYKYAIRAYKTVDGKDVLSPSYPTVTSSTNPATVSFKLTAGSKKVTVNWSKVTGATGYKVYYKTSANGKWIGLKTTTGTSYTKTGLTKGKTYYFTVKAYRTVGGKTYNGTFTTKSVKVK